MTAPTPPKVVGGSNARTPWGNRARADADANVHETHGGETPAILAYFVAGKCSYHATEDETPWCAASVCAWLELSGYRSPRSAAAHDFAAWGDAVETDLAITDDIVVIRHKAGADGSATGSSSGYHVALFAGWVRSKGRTTHVRLLGGNQGDAVKVSDFPLVKYEIVAVRRPTHPNAPAGA